MCHSLLSHGLFTLGFKDQILLLVCVCMRRMFMHMAVNIIFILCPGQEAKHACIPPFKWYAVCAT
jgi:hypothetical protein